MRVEIICNGKNINEFQGREWSNPFPQLPMVGDFIQLGAHSFDRLPPEEMKEYRVTKRTFSAVRTYNLQYEREKCVLEVEPVSSCRIYEH